ncbi:MAG: hypothetical protein AAGA30_02715 [Planctomycetota bacterium]
MSRPRLIDELKTHLPTSDSVLRKHWANRIVKEKIPLSSLLSLLHDEKQVAQRFTWLIGDLLELDSSVVVGVIPLLFSLRDQMPFPGMRRSVGKCLWYAGVPVEMEGEVIEELFRWLKDNDFSVSCKHYASKTLFDLTKEGRVNRKRLS